MFGQANVLAGLKAKLPRRPSSSSESSVGDVPDAKNDSLSTPKNVSSIAPCSVDENLSDKAWGQDNSFQPRYIYHSQSVSQSARKHTIFVLMFDMCFSFCSTAKVLTEDFLPPPCPLMKIISRPKLS